VGSLDQRYYATGAGRFMTADPYRASAGASDPGSWNRYTYVGGDPTNLRDPRGLESESTEVFCYVDGQPIFSETACEVKRRSASGGPGTAETEPQAPSRQHRDKKWETLHGTLQGLADDVSRFLTSSQISADCEKDLKALGISASDLGNGVSGMIMLDGSTADTYLGDVLPASDPTRETAIKRELKVRSLFGPNGSTAALAFANDNVVWFSTRLVSSFTRGRQAGLLAHEALHNITGLLDTQLQERLFGVGSAEVGLPSNNIGKRLEDNCFKGW
jgi:hypothetical protein